MKPVQTPSFMCTIDTVLHELLSYMSSRIRMTKWTKTGNLHLFGNIIDYILLMCENH